MNSWAYPTSSDAKRDAFRLQGKGRALTPPPGSALIALVALLVASGCNVESRGGDTGGLGGVGGAAPADGCPLGVTVLLSDYVSSQVALSSVSGATLSESVISTASSMTDGLAFALSGDVALPSAPPRSGKIVLLDRYGTDVITWLDPRSGEVTAQLPIGTSFDSNPQDYLELDDDTAWVTRWGQNDSPGSEPHDDGGDILVLDLSDHSIKSSIVIPPEDGLPARPGPLSRVGNEVWVTLDRLASDFSRTGEARLLGFDAKTGQRLETTAINGRKNCGRLTPSPNGAILALACSGALDPDGNVDSLPESGVLLFDAKKRPLRPMDVYEAETIAAEPLQSSLAFADDHTLLIKTQTAYLGESNNRLLSLDITTGQARTLLEASPNQSGTGKGIVFGDIVCAPGCSDTCLMTDADEKALQVLVSSGGTWRVEDAITVEERVGLPPVGLTGR